MTPFMEAIPSTASIAKGEMTYQYRVHKRKGSQSHSEQTAWEKEWPWLLKRGSAEPKQDKLVLALAVWNCG